MLILFVLFEVFGFRVNKVLLVQKGKIQVLSLGYFCVDFWEIEMIQNKYKEGKGVGIVVIVKELRSLSVSKVRKKMKYEYEYYKFRKGF